MKIICFDIGGTKILKAVVEMNGSKFNFLEMEEDKNPCNEKKIKKILRTFCCGAREKYKTKKVGFSIAGIVDLEKSIVFPPEWFGKSKFIFSFLEKKQFSIKVENDGRSFALGEYLFGRVREKKNILALVLGTWIGGGCIMDRKVFRGHHSSSMEVSHAWIVNEKGWRKWGGFSAGRAIEEDYFSTTKKRLSCQEIFKLAEKNDKQAGNAINNASDFLGMGIANLCNILDPEIIVFGGSLSKQRDFVKKAMHIARKNVLNKKANYKFVISSLGNKANLLGAASLFQRQ